MVLVVARHVLFRLEVERSSSARIADIGIKLLAGAVVSWQFRALTGRLAQFSRMNRVSLAMLAIARRFAGDFLSTILFMIVWFSTGNVLIATGVAIAGAIAQIVWMRHKNIEINAMTWASLGLVIVLGAATFLTHDKRFVLMKPSIAHFAIGAIMLRRGWMCRYMPPRVLELAPHVPVIAGYCWAALMFALGAGVIATAATGSVKLWAIYVSVVAVAAKVVAFLLQFLVTRIIVRRRVAATAIPG